MRSTGTMPAPSGGSARWHRPPASVLPSTRACSTSSPRRPMHSTAGRSSSERSTNARTMSIATMASMPTPAPRRASERGRRPSAPAPHHPWAAYSPTSCWCGCRSRRAVMTAIQGRSARGAAPGCARAGGEAAQDRFRIPRRMARRSSAASLSAASGSSVLSRSFGSALRRSLRSAGLSFGRHAPPDPSSTISIPPLPHLASSAIVLRLQQAALERPPHHPVQRPEHLAVRMVLLAGERELLPRMPMLRAFPHLPSRQRDPRVLRGRPTLLTPGVEVPLALRALPAPRPGAPELPQQLFLDTVLLLLVAQVAGRDGIDHAGLLRWRRERDVRGPLLPRLRRALRAAPGIGPLAERPWRRALPHPLAGAGVELHELAPRPLVADLPTQDGVGHGLSFTGLGFRQIWHCSTYLLPVALISTISMTFGLAPPQDGHLTPLSQMPSTRTASVVASGGAWSLQLRSIAAGSGSWPSFSRQPLQGALGAPRLRNTSATIGRSASISRGADVFH